MAAMGIIAGNIGLSLGLAQNTITIRHFFLIVIIHWIAYSVVLHLPTYDYTMTLPW